MYVEREVEGIINQLWKEFPSIFIVGPRRSGKTTLVKKLACDFKARYISLDDPDALELFDKDIKLFSKRYLDEKNVIDEIQYGKDPGRKLKYLIDLEGKRFLVTGSSARAISMNVLSYLVGRATVVVLYPFSLKEAALAEIGTYDLTEREWKRIVSEALRYGLFPEVVLSKNKENVLASLVSTLLLKEVPLLEDVSPTELYLVSKALSFVTSILNYSMLAETTGLSYYTVKKVLNALEEAFLVKKVRRFPDKLSNLRKQPKAYFIDPGIYAQIRGIKEPDGRSMEHLVLSELLKQGYEPYFWRSKDGAEVDFIVETEQGIIPIEVKLKAPEKKISRSFRSFIKRFKPEKGLIVDAEGIEWKIKVEETEVTKVPVWELSETL